MSQIKQVANHLFEEAQLEAFFNRSLELCGDDRVLDCLINLSTDQVDELEISFFTEKKICDVTLSRGQVFSCEFQLGQIESVLLEESAAKWTLKINGEKKLDYNIVKPGTPAELIRYQNSLQITLNRLLLERPGVHGPTNGSGHTQQV